MTQVSQHAFSVEFFPPKGPKGAAHLDETIADLSALEPAFFSVTFGAGGTARSGTLETIQRIFETTSVSAVPHLSCIEGTQDSIRRMLDNYKAAGSNRIVALRGDLPNGTRNPGVFSYANELVAFIKERHGDDFHVEVGAYPEYHPQAPSAEADLDNFVRKVDAGADSAMTQYFYNADAYFRFVDAAAARGVHIPIVPGIMPIIDYPQIARFSAMCGAEIPRWIAKPMESFGDDKKAVQTFGLDVVARLCEQLLAGGAPGLHFYSLNQSWATLRLWHQLGLPMPPDSGTANE